MLNCKKIPANPYWTPVESTANNLTVHFIKVCYYFMDAD